MIRFKWDEIIFIFCCLKKPYFYFTSILLVEWVDKFYYLCQSVTDNSCIIEYLWHSVPWVSGVVLYGLEAFSDSTMTKETKLVNVSKQNGLILHPIMVTIKSIFFETGYLNQL